MIKEFFTFCEELFSSISPYTAEAARQALSQFETMQQPVQYITRIPFAELSQGDIFTDIPFRYMLEDGTYGVKRCKAFLLTNTCDCVRNDNLTFAAVLPISDFGTNPIDGIIHNKAFQFLYFPDESTKDYVVDFGLLNSISRSAFLEAISKSQIKKLVSLSWIGYYFFLCKLTVFFMRPEDAEVNKSRAS